ncbi:MAG: glycosyltransferase family 39 protein [Desulfarculaceae bacterium]
MPAPDSKARKPRGWPCAAGVTRAAVCLLLAGAAWRIGRYLLNFPLWGDEAGATLSLMFRDYAGLMGPLIDQMIAPVGYLWSQRAIAQMLGYSEWSLRLGPLLASLAGMILFYHFTRKVLSRWEAMLSVGFFASTYWLVRYAAEVRHFSLDVLVSLTLLILAHEVWSRPQRAAAWLPLIGASTMGVWLSYPGVFVSAGMILALSLGLRQRYCWQYLLGLAVLCLFTGLSFLLVYKLHISGQYASAQSFLAPSSDMWVNAFPDWSKPWTVPWWLLKTHISDMLSYPMGGKNGGSIITFLLVCIGAVTLGRRGDFRLLSLLLAPALVGLGAASLRLYPYGNTMRTMLYLAPGVCMLAGVGLLALLKTVLSPRKVKRGCWAASSVFIAICLLGIARDIIHPYKHLDPYQVRQAFRDLGHRAKPQDIILTFCEYGPLPPDELRWHGRGFVFRYYLIQTFPQLKGVWPAKPWPPCRYRKELSITRGFNHKIWLLLLQNASGSLNERQLALRLQCLCERFGAPIKHVYEIELKNENNQYIVAYEFKGKQES